MRCGAVLVAAWLWATAVAPPLVAQVAWRDLVLTAGASFETYSGRLPDITTFVVDSTDRADAAVGQLGGRGALDLFSGQSRRLTLRFDAGLRQFAADGFVVRDYAPRELVGSVGLEYGQSLASLGRLSLTGHLRGRSVSDRPPMPLFIAPGYRTASGGAFIHFRPVRQLRFDLAASGEVADYVPPMQAPYLDLLDRRVFSVEVGAEFGSWYTVRLFGGVDASAYPEQHSFDPVDPNRRDGAFRVGAQWGIREPFIGSLEVEGTLNRSNSNRPEYNAIRTTLVAAAPLPADLNLQFYGAVTGKTYIHESDVPRLVPGEEADNSSVFFVSLSRPVTQELDAAVRLGWTRAESEIADAYFQRYSGAVYLHYRFGPR